MSMLIIIIRYCSVIKSQTVDFCCCYQQIFTSVPTFSPHQKLCSRHLVITSLVIVLRTLTNNYFLLFSPFTMYRWKNPQYKFLLLLDRQWPMYAQCRRCVILQFMFEMDSCKKKKKNFKTSIRLINVKNVFGGKEAAVRMKSHFAQRFLAMKLKC